MKFSFILLLLIGLTSCSRKSPQELLHEGNEAYENKMVDQALDCYLQIVDRAPESPYADTAQYRAFQITPEELKQKLDAGEDMVVVDLRHSVDFGSDNAKIPGAKHLDPEEIELRHQEIPRDRDIVLYCT